MGETAMTPEFDGPAIGALHGALTPGSKGWEVTELQRRITGFGFEGVEADGIYGPVTTAAVKALQSAIKRPANGIFDSFLDAAMRQAESNPASMPGKSFASVAQAWNTAREEQAMTPDAAADAADPDAQPAQDPSQAIVPAQGLQPVVQVVEDVMPFWRKPTFWLLAGGSALMLFAMLGGNDKKAPAFVPPAGGEGGDDPDSFFGGSEKPRRRKPKRKHKGKAKRAKALAAADEIEIEIDPESGEIIESDEDPADEPEVEATAGTPERDEKGHFVAKDGKPKRKRKPRKAKKDLAATAAAEPGVEKGDSDADDDMDIESDTDDAD
jgi:peptidoglycan hydrolase-like protein with peptidoglycan-binding domain